MSWAHGRCRVRRQRCPALVSLEAAHADMKETYDSRIECDVGSHDECANQQLRTMMIAPPRSANSESPHGPPHQPQAPHSIAQSDESQPAN